MWTIGCRLKFVYFNPCEDFFHLFFFNVPDIALYWLLRQEDA